MNTQKVYSELKSTFPKSTLHQNHPLAPYTTVKIGGPADIFVHTKSSEELKNILLFCRDVIHSTPTNNIPITILGNGSNVLISDSGIRGIVIKNDSKEIEILPNNQAKISSGTQVSSAIDYLAQHQLSGLEEFSYIPSSIGGAIYGNIHGFYKNNFQKLINTIQVFDFNDGQIKDIIPDPSQWKYDYSPLQDQPNLIVISVILNFTSQKTELIQKTVKEINTLKSSKQLMNSLGSVFKNIPGHDPIGQIVDQKLNLKKYSIGDAQVSPLHANFIINTGHATASDYLKLIKYIQQQAKEKLNLNFEPEIKFLGQF